MTIMVRPSAEELDLLDVFVLRVISEAVPNLFMSRVEKAAPSEHCLADVGARAIASAKPSRQQ